MSEIDTGLHYPIAINKLPSTWSIGHVGEYCQEVQSGFACGRHSDTDIGIPHLRPMNVSREGSLNFDVIKYVSSDYDTRRLSENDVLFNNTNSPELIGKTAYINNKGSGLAFSNHMTRLRFHQAVLPKFGALQLHFLWMARYFLHRCVKHVNQASISAGELAKSIPFIAPPLPEQHRIVAKIEELFSELDKGIENLKTARAQLKVYRQALLKHVFEGKLTAQWRAENQSKLETADALLKRIQQERAQRFQQQLADWETAGKPGSKPKAPKPLPPLTAEELTELPVLPEGWGWFKLADLSDISGGLTKNQKRNTLPIRRPFLRVGNVYANRLELGDIHDTGISEAEIERVTLVKGDILVVEGNGSVDQIGRVAIWNGAIEGCVHQNHLIKARPLNLVRSEFILYFLMSELGRKFIVRAASSTSGLHTLNRPGF